MSESTQGDPARARRVDPASMIATVGGLGFLPGAPATWTSLVVTLALGLIGAQPGLARFVVLAAIILATCVVAVWSAGRAEMRYGHDARCIVIDEVAGMLITAWLVPWDVLHLTAAFVLFRGFDVLKPPPAYQLQSLPGGWGVLMDDVAAGLYGLGVLFLARLLPGF
jgi:phosphatidylglycerophosphatase A